MKMQATHRIAAIAMASAAALAIAGFTALGSIFEYPQILKEPTAEILASYQAHQGPITAWFLALVVSAALLAPIAILLGRIARNSLTPWIIGFGVAAAVVQVIGLSRWVVLVPRISDDSLVPGRTASAEHTFGLVHTWLGTVLGETIGYALTATFTVLVVIAVTQKLAPRWMSYLGYAAAALIATGVVIPLGLSAASITNFAGYVAWCLWLIAMAVVLWRLQPVGGAEGGAASASSPRAMRSP